MTEISQAIESRNLISFYYENFLRIVEPYTLGLSPKRKTLLSAYQIGGESHRQPVPCWGLFDLTKITKLEILQEKFLANREEYSRGDSRMPTIYFEVA
jgi:predicted DNA-binding transcriptional regulator YafY